MILSLDISTSVIGLAIFDNEHKLHEITFIKFNKKEKSLFKKLDFFIEFMQKYNHIEFKEIIIEKELLKFKGKFSNALTLNMLARMNALVSGYLYKAHGVEPVYYNASEARKLAFPNLIIPQSFPNKKYLVWEAFSKSFPVVNWEYSKKTHKLVEGTFDSVDAAVVGLAHIVSKIKYKSKIKEDKISK